MSRWSFLKKLFRPGVIKGASQAVTVIPVVKTTLWTRLAGGVSKLPVVRLLVGGAGAAVIIDWWSDAQNAVSDLLGTDPETSSLLLGAVLFLCAVAVISAAVSIFKR